MSATMGPPNNNNNNNNNNMGNTEDPFEFNDRLRKAYEEWSETYGDNIDESRMEIFSYHYVMAENYFQETGNRIRLNEYADLTAVEFQRLKEMGGMIEDVDGASQDSQNSQNSPHWAPEDVAQMDFFAKQTSQRQQAFQDNNTKSKHEDEPKPPPGYFSVVAPPEGDTELSAYRESYQQKFTQSYLDSLNSKAKDAQDTPPPPPQEQPPSLLQDEQDQPNQSDMYMFNEDDNNINNNDKEPANKYKEPQSFHEEQPPSDKPGLQDLINSRYGGIGFLEDSAMVGNSAMDYKFFPALSKMYNLDYPEQQQQPPPPQMDRPPPRPPPQDFLPPPPPPQEYSQEQDKRETFMNAMTALYSQMFGQDGPPDREAFAMMDQMMMNGGGGPMGGNMRPPPMGMIEQHGMPHGGQWGPPPPEQESWGPPRENRPVEPRQERRQAPPPQPQEEEEEIGTDVFLGELSYSMTRGRVIEWLKNVGDEVQRGEPLCVIESDTYTMVDGQKYAESHDVVALENGILAAMYADVAETVPVGSILGVIAADQAEAARVSRAKDQERVDFVKAPTQEAEVYLDENGYPVDEDGYLLEDVPVDEDGYPIGEYENGYPVDEEGYYAIDEYGVEDEGYAIDDGYDENGYQIDDYGADEGGGYDDRGIHGEGFGEESAYVRPVDDDPDLPSWVLGNAPSIAPSKVASKYPVIPSIDSPQPSTPKPKEAARRPAPKRGIPKGRAGPPRRAGRIDDTRAKRPRGRIDDVRSPARKRGAAGRVQKPKIDGTEITLSELANGMTKGTVIEWMRNVGDRVIKGEPLAVVESDTFMMIEGQKYAESYDVEASQDGILAAVYTGVKQTMPVGSLLGVIADNEAAARNVPQANPYETAGNDSYESQERTPVSRTQRAAAAAVQASTDPVKRVRAAADSGFVDSVEQVDEDVLQSRTEVQSDDFDRRFMTREELESADFAAAGAFGGGGVAPASTPLANDDRDLPSWVLGNAPSIAPGKVASKFPVVPKISQPSMNSPSINSINAARNAALQNDQANSDIPPPTGRSGAPPQRSQAPPIRRGAPPKRRGAPPKSREASGRGRIDDVRAPLNPPEEEEGTEIVMSVLSYGMKKGMIIEWLKNVGDPVKKGEPIAVVESDTFMVIDTQKYAESHDILASEDGFLAAQFGGPKELFDVGSVLGVIADSALAARNVRKTSSTPRSRAQPNRAAARSTFIPEETNVPGERYVPPPEPGAESETASWADDPDLPSWVRGDAPSIAPSKVASKYPVIPRRSTPTPTPATQSPTTGAVNGSTGTQRRIPKGRYDDTRARPKQIRVEDTARRPPPRGRIDDIRAPFTQQASGVTQGRDSYSKAEPQLFPDLSKSRGSNDATNGDFSATAEEEPPETEEPQYMPDLSGTASSPEPPEEDRADVSSDDDQPDPVAEDDTNVDVPVTEEEQPEIPTEDVTVEASEDFVPGGSEADVTEDVVAESGEGLFEVVQGDVEAEENADIELQAEEDAIPDIPEAIEDTSEEHSEPGEVDVELSAVEEDEKFEEVPDDVELESETEIISDDVAEDVTEPMAAESDTNVTAKADVVLVDDPESPEEMKSETVASTRPSPSSKKPVPEINVQEAVTNSTETMVQEILVTAKARTAAEEAKIDLTAIQGTGESGCITLDDVKLAIARKKPKIGIRFLTDKPKTRNSSPKEKSKKERP
jgi:pyruvate/2-oxoglutarate dehydrogenase complex dihydrolipoamide acyltransferase (E2) component